ncbi:MAG: type VI secretion system baseplate subunit TssG [Proteobacteria bacterium]|jgi:type VI secretion system protein ImpH|nr:type VI secretion system baseplate subunit TssG [Pseudomonadota bacterium]
MSAADERAHDERAHDERAQDERAQDERAQDERARDERALAELFERVSADPSAFDFFALLRRVDTLRREWPRTGEALRPRQEALRLAQAPELDFAPAPLHTLELRAGLPPRLAVRFFGLLGPQGPMPLHLSELARDRLLHHADGTLAHFLDVFHHRLLTLFYRAWAEAQPAVQLDRPDADRFRHWLVACGGAPEDGGAVPTAALAYQAGWFADRSRHPEMLCKVIGRYFGIRVHVEEHVGHWLGIAQADRSRLGCSRSRAESGTLEPARLGRDANAGSRVWDRQYRFRLHLGPLGHDEYFGLLPGGRAWAPLLHWVRVLAGRGLLWDLQLELRPEERPPPRLGSRARLGLTCWLGRREPPAGARSTRVPRSLRLRPQTSFLLRRQGATDA